MHGMSRSITNHKGHESRCLMNNIPSQVITDVTTACKSIEDNSINRKQKIWMCVENVLQSCLDVLDGSSTVSSNPTEEIQELPSRTKNNPEDSDSGFNDADALQPHQLVYLINLVKVVARNDVDSELSFIDKILNQSEVELGQF